MSPSPPNKAAAPVDAEALLNVCSAILPAVDLKEAAGLLLSSLLDYEPQLARAVLFGGDGNKGLAPLASRERAGAGAGYQISKEMLRQCARDGVTHVKHVESGGKARVVAVLPLSAAGDPLLLHAELAAAPQADGAVAVERLERVLRLVAPKLQALSMSARVDGWVTGLMMTINAAIEAKDTYTSGHSQRVARYAVAIARARELDAATMQALHLSALCHDIGKIGVPDEILKKPGRLSAEEFGEMKEHPQIGHHLIAGAPNAALIATGIKHHHERWDGTGYPDGLAGPEIPLFARIIGVADAFDAMTSGRPYSGYVGQDEAVKSLQDKTDLFDGEVLADLAKAHDDGSLSMRTGTAVRQKPA